MTTSLPMSLKSLISREDVQLTPAQLGYMNGLAKSKAHEVVLQLFSKLAKEDGMTRAFVARRLGKKPEQVTRWLGAPGNWTLETLSSLLASMGYAPTFGVQPLNDMPRQNYRHKMAPASNMHPSNPQIFNSGLVDIKVLSSYAPLNLPANILATRSTAEDLVIEKAD